MSCLRVGGAVEASRRRTPAPRAPAPGREAASAPRRRRRPGCRVARRGPGAVRGSRASRARGYGGAAVCGRRVRGRRCAPRASLRSRAACARPDPATTRPDGTPPRRAGRDDRHHARHARSGRRRAGGRGSTRTLFSLMAKRSPAAIRARTGMAPRGSVDRRSSTRCLAVGATTARTLHDQVRKRQVA